MTIVWIIVATLMLGFGVLAAYMLFLWLMLTDRWGWACIIFILAFLAAGAGLCSIMSGWL